MPNNDSHQHVVKTSAQWAERAVEFWVIPRGCLCVELTPDKKTKLKVGEGNKYYAQLPYVNDIGDLSEYYTKEEIDRLFDNLNRMAIMSTDEYDSKIDLPLTDNKLGDVRFVKSASPSIKTDPDVYLWNGRKWIFVGYDLVEIDLSQYIKRDEFEPVAEKVNEMYPKMHTHANKAKLDAIEEPYTTAEKEKLAGLENYDDTELRGLIRQATHVHPNKSTLDQIEKPFKTADKEKLDSLENYDDTDLRNRVTAVESVAHTHSNKAELDSIYSGFVDEHEVLVEFKTVAENEIDSLQDDVADLKTKIHTHSNKNILDSTTAPYTREDKQTLDDLANITVFDGASATYDGFRGYVPAPHAGEQTYFLRGDGTWAQVKGGSGDKYKAGDGIFILSGEVTSDTFPFEIYSRSSTVKQYIIYGNVNGVGDLVNGEYHVPIKVSAPGHSDRISTIILSEPMYAGDYIDFEKQVFAHYRTDITYQVQNRSTDTTQTGISSTGELYYKSSYNGWGGSPRVTNYYEIDPTATYEVSRVHPDNDFSNSLNINIYDANKVRTRTIVTSTTAVTTFTPVSGEVYIRQSYTGEGDGYCHIFKLQPVETPCILQEVILYPNAINTIDVITTNKPTEVYFEVEEPEEIDPDDPMSKYSGIIYNDGVLDVTQEDPNAMNELTIHFRESSKVLTIPDNQYTLPPATTSTLGGVIVGNGLSIDQNGVLGVSQEQAVYTAGAGVDIQQGTSKTYRVVEYLQSDGTQTIDTEYCKTVNDGSLNVNIKWRFLSVPSNRGEILSTHDPNDSLKTGSVYIGAAKGGSMSEAKPCAGICTSDGGASSFQYDSNGSCTVIRKDAACWDDNGDISFNKTDGYYQITTGATWRNIFLFGSVAGVIYECQIFDDDIMVCDLVPCIRDEDDAQGFYDRVRETFYPNTGTAFTVGPETGEVINQFSLDHPSDPYEIINTGVINAIYDDTNLELTLKKLDGDVVIPVSDTVYNAGNNINITGQREQFTKLEYITAHGNQTINTHRRIRSQHGKFEYKFQLFDWPSTDLSDRYEFMIGGDIKSPKAAGSPVIGMCKSGGGTQGTVAGIIKEALNISWYWINQSSTTSLTEGSMEYLPDSNIKLNGNLNTTSDWPIINDSEIHLFGTDDYKVQGKLYYVKIYDDDTLIFDGIPVRRNSDGELGIFDRVDNEFFTNDLGLGEYSFVAGPDESGADPILGDYIGTTKTISATVGVTSVTQDTNNPRKVNVVTNGDNSSFTIPAPVTMTGASASANGTAGYVPQPLTGDESKYLRGDGTWAVVQSGELYDAGDGIEFTYNHMIDMLFDRTAFLNSVTEVKRGTISKDTITGAFTLTATENDAYTSPDRSSLGTVYSIQADPNTTYKLTWTSDDPTVSGKVYAFENGDTIKMYIVDQSTLNELTFITSSTCQTLNFRFGVQNSGDSITYSAISLYKITGDATINAKLGNGLHFDSNDAIEVDSMIGATSQANGESGTVPQPLIADKDKFLKGDGSWDTPSGTYTLPPASASTLGGVKVGAGLSMNANDELGVTSPYVTSVTNQGSTAGVITVTKSDGISSDVDILGNIRLILNCNFDSSVTRNVLGEPVNAPGSGTQMNASIMGDLTVLEV